MNVDKKIIISCVSLFCLCLFCIGIIVYFSNNKKKTVPISQNDLNSIPNESITGFDRTKTDKLLNKKSTIVKGTKETPIYIIMEFLTDEECKEIIKSSNNRFVNSPLSRENPNDPNFRTSKTCVFDGNIIQNIIEEKIIREIDLYNNNYEPSQIQYYQVGNSFKPHWDYFHSDHGKYYLNNGGQRTWTFMIYLNDVEKGGETNFTNINETIHPKKGTAVIWCNLDENGNPDKNTMHQGLPIEKGEKWIITKWFLGPKK
jgi:prolyl 4-hydroxylase